MVYVATATSVPANKDGHRKFASSVLTGFAYTLHTSPKIKLTS